jgi:hypothetical protein
VGARPIAEGLDLAASGASVWACCMLVGRAIETSYLALSTCLNSCRTLTILSGTGSRSGVDCRNWPAGGRGAGG